MTLELDHNQLTRDSRERGIARALIIALLMGGLLVVVFVQATMSLAAPPGAPIPGIAAAVGVTETYSITQHIYVPLVVRCDVTRFAVIGDYGDSSQAERDVADLVKSWNPDLIITTGDNNYDDGEASTIDSNIGQFYSEFIHPYHGGYVSDSRPTANRFFPTLGNHDWRTSGAQPYLDYFTLPGNERYYSFTWGLVHFFAIDGDEREPDGISDDSVQATWLRDALAASTATWKIVYMHQPPFSSGPHGSSSALQWPYGEWGATAVLAGHDHAYERILRDGFPYFVNGLGGRSLYFFGEAVPGSQVRYRDDYGAMFVEASCEHITFRFHTRSGYLVDVYTLNSTGE